VVKGASLISGTVASLSHQIQELHGKVSIVRCQQDDLSSNQARMHETITNLDLRIGQMQQALLIQGQEGFLCSQIGDNESRINSLHVAAMFLTGKEKEEFNKAIDKFGDFLADKRKLLSKFSDQLTAVIGQPLLPTP